MAYKNRVKYETLRSIDTSTFTGAYQLLGTPTTNAAYIVGIGNGSNVGVTISTDGSTDMDYIPAGANRYYRYGKFNDQSSPQLPSKTQFFVKGSAGTGLFTISIQYVETN